jgi:hypothetical protein
LATGRSTGSAHDAGHASTSAEMARRRRGLRCGIFFLGGACIACDVIGVRSVRLLM